MLNRHHMANPLAQLSVDQLQRAIEIKEQIESLEAELGQLLGSAPAAPRRRGRPPGRRGPGRPLGSGHQAAVTRPGRRGRRKMSPAARARLAEMARRRWAKAKAAGRSKL